MAEVKFTPGKTVETIEPEITVAAGLAPGSYRFQLVVHDNSGNASVPVVLTVTVFKPPPVGGGGVVNPGRFDRIPIR